jgi:hypothetical protein
MEMMLRGAVLLLALESCTAFAPAAHPSAPATVSLSLTTEKSSTDKLPPGRPVGRFRSLFFDDTNRFLNSKRMGSYQVQKKEKFGCIFRTNLFYKPAVVVTDKRAMNQVFIHERNNAMPAVVPPHHQELARLTHDFVAGSSPAYRRRELQHTK